MPAQEIEFGERPQALSLETVRNISAQKKEPEWMLNLRTYGCAMFNEMTMPKFGPDLSGLEMDRIEMYIKSPKMGRTWAEVPKEIRETFEKLGIPKAEREGLAGVGAQYDSEVIYHNIRKQVEGKGVVYLPMEEAVRDKKWGKVVQEHFMRLVRPDDHKFAALHAAVYSGGSFVYVPKGVAVELPLQSYFRLNTPGAGQFEHTLIILEPGADLHFIEGCSAPKYDTANLHAGCVELYVGEGAHLKYSTVESWSKNMYNLNTKKAKVAKGGVVEWVTGNFGSKVSMLYPTTILAGENSRCEYTGVTFAGKGQNLDTGLKIIHQANNTCSLVDVRSLAKDGGICTFRSVVEVASGAKGVKSLADCKSLMLDGESHCDTVPKLVVCEPEAEVAHEASVGKLSEKEVQYLQTRGFSETEARGMLVRGFTAKTVKELPVEYAMEMNNLIAMEMEGNT